MKTSKVLFFFALLFLSVPRVLTAQDINDSLRIFYEERKYDLAIQLVKDEEQLNEEGLFYVGLCFYAKQEDRKALYCFERAIEKKPLNPEYRFYKGFTYLYLKDYSKALKSLRRARNFGKDDYNLYLGLGDAFMGLELVDSALNEYTAATRYEDCPPRPIIEVARIHQEQKHPEKALKTYYQGKDRMDSTASEYALCLYNIGLLEYFFKNYVKAEENLKLLLELYPKDYLSISKLIKALYAQEKYDEVYPYRKQLYKAFKNGKLPEEMQEMFCFDQFEWNGKQVMAFEKYEAPENQLYYKHLFFVTEEDGEVSQSVHTEHSFKVKAENKMYVLGKINGDTHYTYWQYLYDQAFEYPELKNSVLQILNEKAEPTSFSKLEE